jgi:hypothetical protein
MKIKVPSESRDIDEQTISDMEPFQESKSGVYAVSETELTGESMPSLISLEESCKTLSSRDFGLVVISQKRSLSKLFLRIVLCGRTNLN